MRNLKALTALKITYGGLKNIYTEGAAQIIQTDIFQVLKIKLLIILSSYLVDSL